MSIFKSNNTSSWFDASNGLNALAAKQKIPLLGTFEITARCNLSCNMCYIRRDSTNDIFLKEKSTDEWIDMGRQVAKAGTLFLLITGGEPLIRCDFKKIYEELNKMGFIITLYTNGTLITENFIKWISKIPPNKVGITLYGASPETYKRVTGNAEGFNKTIQGIDLLLKAGIIVYLRTTITRDNVKDIEKIDFIAHERSLTINHVFNLTKPVRDAVSNVEQARLTPIDISNLNKKNATCDVEDIHQNRINPLETNNEVMFCSAGKSSYWLTWDGKMLPCVLMNSPFANPFQSNFASSWDLIKNKVCEITGPDECKSCEYKSYCDVCPGKLQAETGYFNKVSFYICEMAKMTKKYYIGELK